MDYTYTITNNINVGTATITITGTGTYFTGTRTASFKITCADLSAANITVNENPIYYDGTAKKPAVTVSLNGKNLIFN